MVTNWSKGQGRMAEALPRDKKLAPRGSFIAALAAALLLVISHSPIS
jgi:hypothetical protein